MRASSRRSPTSTPGSSTPSARRPATNWSTTAARYPPKAVIGLACRSLLGRVLLPEEFSGGEAPGQANFVLRELGFTVDEAKGSEEPGGAAAADWSPRRGRSDRRRLLHDAAGRAGRRAVQQGRPQPGPPGPPGRPLEELGRVQAPEHQRRPGRHGPAVHRRLQAGPELPEGGPAAGRRGLPGPTPRVLRRAGRRRGPEPRRRPRPSRSGRSRITSRTGPSGSSSRRRTRSPGSPGEGRGSTSPAGTPRTGSWANSARSSPSRSRSGGCSRSGGTTWRRRSSGSPRRAGTAWGSTCSRSTRTTESEQFIEVKTTGLGKHFPFYVTANEVRCSEDCPERFRLYRVFDFARDPRIYVVTGALSRECRLEPVEYRASV